MASEDMAICRGSASVEVFLPARHFELRSEYLAQRDKATEAQVMLWHQRIRDDRPATLEAAITQ